jgi:hypothetical protein
VVVVDVAGAQLLVHADRRFRGAGRRLIVVRGTSELERFLSTAGLEDRLELAGEPPRLRHARRSTVSRTIVRRVSPFTPRAH